MCRLFAVLAHEPVRVDRAFAALKQQAVEHKDGWGMAVFQQGAAPKLEVSITPANTCTRFSQLGSDLSTKSLLVHLRLASVGGVREENAHPFEAKGLAFMHNGTLANFKERSAAFEALLDPRLKASLKGETDSERCFALFLTLLGDDRSLDGMARALANVMRTAASLCDTDDAAAKKSAMNFLVTDGTRLVATRRGRTLFHAAANGAHYVSSEALWPDAEWLEVPEETALLIDESLVARKVPLAELSL